VRQALRGGDLLRINVATLLGQAFGSLVLAAKGDHEGPLTFKSFATRWTTGELARLFPDHVTTKRTADDDEMRLEKWVYPVVKDLPLQDFTLAHAQEVLRRIPPSLSRGTRRHVAQHRRGLGVECRVHGEVGVHADAAGVRRGRRVAVAAGITRARVGGVRACVRACVRA
jgi:hypothetical protein